MGKLWLTVGMIIGMVALYGVFVMLLFNWLSPTLGFANELDYFQSCGLTFLCWLLFKNEK